MMIWTRFFPAQKQHELILELVILSQKQVHGMIILDQFSHGTLTKPFLSPISVLIWLAKVSKSMNFKKQNKTAAGCPLKKHLKVARFALHPILFQIAQDSLLIYKGTEGGLDSYSSFFDNQRLRETKLRSELLKKGVTDVYVCGLATDICVGNFAPFNLHEDYQGGPYFSNFD